jgi:hypothetical protein
MLTPNDNSKQSDSVEVIDSWKLRWLDQCEEIGHYISKGLRENEIEDILAFLEDLRGFEYTVNKLKHCGELKDALRRLEGTGNDIYLMERTKDIRENEEIMEILEEIWVDDQLTRIQSAKYTVEELLRQNVLQNILDLKSSVEEELSDNSSEFWQAKDKLSFFRFVWVRELREIYSQQRNFWEEQLREVERLDDLNENRVFKSSTPAGHGRILFNTTIFFS